MVKLEYAEWGDSTASLKEQALKAERPRMQERLLALSEISEGKSAT